MPAPRPRSDDRLRPWPLVLAPPHPDPSVDQLSVLKQYGHSRQSDSMPKSHGFVQAESVQRPRRATGPKPILLLDRLVQIAPPVERADQGVGVGLTLHAVPFF